MYNKKIYKTNKYKKETAAKYAELYPETLISAEVLAVLAESDYKMEYTEYDLKHQKVKKNKKTGEEKITPVREVSFEYLSEEKYIQFAEERDDFAEIFEDMDVETDKIEKMLHYINKLSAKDKDLIQHLYFKKMTETQYAEKIKDSQQNINKRKHNILSKLKRYL